MRDRIFALLVHNDGEPLEPLKRMLKELSVGTYSVSTCKEARALLVQTQPHLVFVVPFLSDGSWVDIVNSAEKVDVPLNVIVVGQTASDELSVSVMKRGAYGFLAPPLTAKPFADIVQSASLDVRSRRDARLCAAVI